MHAKAEGGQRRGLKTPSVPDKHERAGYPPPSGVKTQSNEKNSLRTIYHPKSHRCVTQNAVIHKTCVKNVSHRQKDNNQMLRRAEHFLCNSKTSFEPEPLWLLSGYWVVPERPDRLPLHHHICQAFVCWQLTSPKIRNTTHEII